MHKSQVAMEYMILMGFIVLLTAPLILIYYKYSYSTEYELSQNQIFNMGNKIIDNAESVYYQGNQSKTTMKVRIPEKIIVINVTRNEITFSMDNKGKRSDVVIVSKINLTGNINSLPGIRYISITSQGNYVSISSS
jgi:hypothetical protein